MARKHSPFPRTEPRYNAKGEITSYIVDYGEMTVNGKRTRPRPSFKTKFEADAHRDEVRLTRRNEGTAALGGISRIERMDADSARTILDPLGATLLQAAQFYAANSNVIRCAKTINEVIAEVVAVKTAKGRSLRYQGDLRNRLEKFACDARFEGRLVHEIQPQQIDEWLTSFEPGIGPVTQNNYLAVLNVAFNFAIGRKYAVSNPVNDVEEATENRARPGILGLEECRVLMASAVEFGDEKMIASIAIDLFAGLRPNSELWRLDWGNVPLEADLPEIGIFNSKNFGSERHVPIEDNLLLWLKPLAKSSGPVSLVGDAYYWRLQDIRKLAVSKFADPSQCMQLVTWPGDVLRHTYASMHYAKFKNGPLTVHNLGHGVSMTMFKQRYHARVREADALAFWQIFPKPVA
jgi:integrase